MTVTNVSLSEYLLLRDRYLVVACIAVLTILAWIYLLTGAGMDMGILEMTRQTLLPQSDAMTNMSMQDIRGKNYTWDWQFTLAVLSMWWIMMIAMMLPGAAPMMLLYARVLRHSSQLDSRTVALQVLNFIFGYLFIWLIFSAMATIFQWWLEQAHWLSMHLQLNRGWIAGGVLIAVGLYQLSPMKQVCLKYCQSPAHFIATHMKPGRQGAMVMGIEHGLFCLGCCWLLMLLLFVGGVMNLIWIVIITLFVLVEKLTRHQRQRKGIALISAFLLVTWGFLIIFKQAILYT